MLPTQGMIDSIDPSHALALCKSYEYGARCKESDRRIYGQAASGAGLRCAGKIHGVLSRRAVIEPPQLQTSLAVNH